MILSKICLNKNINCVSIFGHFSKNFLSEFKKFSFNHYKMNKTETLLKSNSTKRKIEDDSEDELFFKFENEKKKKSLDSTTEIKYNSPSKDSKVELNVKENESIEKLLNKDKDDKENIEIKNGPTKTLDESALSPLPKQNKLKQGTLCFKPLETKSKPVPKTPSKAVLDAEARGEFNIENYLYDSEWKQLLKDEFKKPYFVEINNKIKPGYEKGINRPPKDLVFNALNTTKLKNIKVVIIGQDPYHDDGQAHGLSFSVPVGKKLPPSLKNIFTELKNDLPDFKRDDKNGGCLQKWAERGVFLLNAFLTVEAHKAGSHSKFGWDIFTDKVIKLITDNNEGCVFILWGNFAQKKENLIDKKKHKVLKSAHPSPFSVTRFYGCKCFSQANSYLKSIGKEPIDWNLI